MTTNFDLERRREDRQLWAAVVILVLFMLAIVAPLLVAKAIARMVGL